eukprot:2157888-Amphidinium_carterae.1
MIFVSTVDLVGGTFGGRDPYMVGPTALGNLTMLPCDACTARSSSSILTVHHQAKDNYPFDPSGWILHTTTPQFTSVKELLLIRKKCTSMAVGWLIEILGQPKSRVLGGA